MRWSLLLPGIINSRHSHLEANSPQKHQKLELYEPFSFACAFVCVLRWDKKSTNPYGKDRKPVRNQGSNSYIPLNSAFVFKDYMEGEWKFLNKTARYNLHFFLMICCRLFSHGYALIFGKVTENENETTHGWICKTRNRLELSLQWNMDWTFRNDIYAK